MSPRQRRGLLLLVLAVAAAVLVFASVLQYTADVSQQLGPRQPVLVVAREATALQPVGAADVKVQLVPKVFAPSNALSSVDDLSGKVPLADLPAGSFVAADDLIPTPALEAGQREVALTADLERTFGQTIRTEDRVDVLAILRDQSSTKAATTVLRIPDTLVLGVSANDAGEQNAVRLAIPDDQAVELSEARTRGADIYLARVPLSEVTP
ncbi:MAG: RcpC/CpaB family pilus assembly protein [Nocardioides sp.]